MHAVKLISCSYISGIISFFNSWIFGQTSITSVSAFYSMSEYYLILWCLTCNFNFENKYTWKLSYAYFSFIFKFRKLKLSPVIRFLILQKVTTGRRIRLSRQQVCHKSMLVTSHKNGTIPGTEKDAVCIC